ncbi:serine hydrolase domain-containing protein [Maribacter sp. HTCC2170]|uniref:serine hydrolase domain-containing protein n=1 Tax=Maribacter sp. (strain HTCC2170 / KCCM 42371) TaxID=313603 RepID=UPI00006BD3C1|nr:serine hydrolase [Maribacter sp. HTCC2170]EAR02658.1 beta-N-acetylglucosaminidase [Maribacter sp. HTCC2170]
MRFLLIILFGLFYLSAYSQEDTAIPLNIEVDDGLSFSTLSNMGMDSTFVYNKVDSIITNGIKKKAFPGAQILVAKNGSIVFHKSYGHHTYDSIQSVSNDDIYDLASVTKISGPLPALMKLVQEGKLDLDEPFSTYWHDWKSKKDKKDLTLREILAHQAGLTPYIVFLSKTIKKNGKLKSRFLRTTSNSRFNNQVYDHLYVKSNFNRKMYRIIKRSKVDDEKKYKYSGLTFLIFPELIERLTGKSYEDYLTENFYEPLGANTLGFNPKTKNFPNQIVPTEIDTLYRHDLTQGWVHDENASLLGGVSGNAGLFGTATDLAKLMQMYQNYGSFNGKQILTEATLKEFTKVQYPKNKNRRGLGFDKPMIGNDTLVLKEAYPAPEVSSYSFGHSGFTGTFVWADPKNQLVYIFLSNRVNPSRTHRNLYNLNIRPAVQQVFYQAVLSN